MSSDRGIGQQNIFPRIPLDDWRRDAACAGADDITLWDASIVVPESASARVHRHARAQNICRTCPVRARCAADVDPAFDEGVRGGHVLPPIHSTKSNNTSVRDRRMSELLKAGVPLDEAAAVVQGNAHRRVAG